MPFRARSNAKIDFSRRASPRELPELMDGDCSYEEFRDCLQSLEKVNRWLLGYRPTLTWLERLPRKLEHFPCGCTPGRRAQWAFSPMKTPQQAPFGRPSNRENALSKPIHIVDVGSGGGDSLRQIARWAQRRRLPVQLTGIDLNPFAARAASEFTPKQLGITWVTRDALVYRPEEPIDIVVSSLLAHHLEDEEIVTLLRWMEGTAQLGWFINDLERAKWTSRAFGWVRWHRIVRHDGPVSFRRAFLKEDWLRLLSAADLPGDTVTVERWRPGRLCVGRWK